MKTNAMINVQKMGPTDCFEMGLEICFAFLTVCVFGWVTVLGLECHK